jgi:hypothetical protein
MSCATEAPDAVEPLSEACLECLTGREDRGCAGSYDACQAIASCDDYVVCQLMGQCFERNTAAACEEEIGCKLPPNTMPHDAGDAGSSLSPRARAREFEDCARSVCRAACGFSK